MAKKGKKYSDSVKLYEKSKQYDPAEAMGLVCKTAKAKFDETVEIHVRLGVDSRHADQQVRGAVVLPNGTGKTVRTLVFTKGDKVQAALDAGADYVGDQEYIDKITKEGWFEFDVVIASPDMMGMIGRLGKVLGPKGLMPSPRQAPSPPTLPVRSRKPRQVRSSTVLTRPTSSTAPSVRCPSARISSARTLTPLSALS